MSCLRFAISAKEILGFMCRTALDAPILLCKDPRWEWLRSGLASGVKLRDRGCDGQGRESCQLRMANCEFDEQRDESGSGITLAAISLRQRAGGGGERMNAGQSRRRVPPVFGCVRPHGDIHRDAGHRRPQPGIGGSHD